MGSSKPRPENRHASASGNPGEIACPRCSASNGPDASFCIECGANLKDARPAGAAATASSPLPDLESAPARGVSCPSCRSDNSLDSAYCVECGRDLRAPEDKEAEVSAVPAAGAAEPEAVSNAEAPIAEADPKESDAAPSEAVASLSEKPPSSPSDSSMTATLRMVRKEFGTGAIFADRYQIVEELGQGGMGRVYRAVDKKVNEEVAIKVVRPEISSDHRVIERFSNELRNARHISHKNICRMYDLFESEGLHFITMEYVPGENLKRFIRRSRQLTVGTAVAIAKQVAEGLEEAHRQGVVHRDLKPQNIMIDHEGNVRIMDFGIASSIKTRGMTVQGAMIGTPDYMSPEQVEGQEADARSDLYALGVVLYEMLTGRVPFEGETPLSVALKHKSLPPPDPASLNPLIPFELRRLILKCLEKDRDKRFSNAGEFLSALHRIEEEIPTAERALPEPVQAEKSATLVPAPKKRRLLPVVVAASLALAVLAVWFLFLRPRPADRPAAAASPPPSRTAETAPPSAEETLSRGFQDLREKKYDAAIASFREILANEPSSVEALLGAGLALKGRGDLEEALAEFQKVIRFDPSDPRAYEHLGDIYSERRETEKALEAYARCGERSPEGETADRVRNKAALLRAAAEKTEARPTETVPAPPAAKPVPVKPSRPAAEPKADISGLLARGIEAFHEKDYEGCIREMRAVLQLDPENTTARRYLDEAPLFLAAETAYREERWEDCLTEARKILALSPDNVQAARYEDMAWQKLAPTKIKSAVDRFVRAANNDQILSFYQTACDPPLFQRIRREAEIVNSLYEQFRARASQIIIRFPAKNKAEVRFTNITTGIMKSEGKRRVVFEGIYVWSMERRGDDWSIVNIQSLPSRK